jgi:hypothetical protein
MGVLSPEPSSTYNLIFLLSSCQPSYGRLRTLTLSLAAWGALTFKSWGVPAGRAILCYDQAQPNCGRALLRSTEIHELKQADAL